jgi:hypothetical protein
MRFVKAASILLIFVACGATAKLPGDDHSKFLGSERDVTTKDGVYEGYEVSRRCRNRGCIGITGTGTNWAAGMERNGIRDESRFRDGFESLRARVHKDVLRDFRSLNTSGLGGGCTGFGLFVGMNDWREFDDAIVRIGRLLREENLREEITLCPATARQFDVARGCAMAPPGWIDDGGAS